MVGRVVALGAAPKRDAGQAVFGKPCPRLVDHFGATAGPDFDMIAGSGESLQNADDLPERRVLVAGREKRFPVLLSDRSLDEMLAVLIEGNRAVEVKHCKQGAGGHGTLLVY